MKELLTEGKELLLKDLYARLYYGFFVHRYSDNADIRIDNINTFCHFLEYSESEDFKPYLRSRSSMTKEEEKEYTEIIVKSQDCSYENNESAATIVNDWYLSKGFDVWGLIPRGLALEASKDMYNLKEK